jgi:hypothetical protein
MVLAVSFSSWLCYEMSVRFFSGKIQASDWTIDNFRDNASVEHALITSVSKHAHVNRRHLCNVLNIICLSEGRLFYR